VVNDIKTLTINVRASLKVIPIAIGTVGDNLPTEKITEGLKVTIAVGITSSHSEQSS
jgi:hypothetical protein